MNVPERVSLFLRVPDNVNKFINRQNFGALEYAYTGSVRIPGQNHQALNGGYYLVSRRGVAFEMKPQKFPDVALDVGYLCNGRWPSIDAILNPSVVARLDKAVPILYIDNEDPVVCDNDEVHLARFPGPENKIEIRESIPSVRKIAPEPINSLYLPGMHASAAICDLHMLCPR
jgi:hypothetical protein